MASGDLTGTRGKVTDKPCAVFDDDDDEISITSFNIDNAWTISVWVYNTIDNPNSIVGDTAATSGYLYIRDEIKSIIFEPAENRTPTILEFDGYGSTLHKWVHLVVTATPTAINAYLDNTAVDNNPQVPDANDISFNITRIGRGYTGLDNSYMGGGLADIKIYNKVLSSTEITKLYNGQKVTDGLIHHWKLDKDYKDLVGSADGTNSGSYLINTLPNKYRADVESINLASDTDKLIIVNRAGRDRGFSVLGVEREE